MIRASCHSADNRLALEFDATPWFREADPQTIRHLAKQGWSSVWVADALEARPGYEGLHQLVEYAATRLREGRWRTRLGRRSAASLTSLMPRSG
jgi:mono/diheme cytochrome c family protein